MPAPSGKTNLFPLSAGKKQRNQNKKGAMEMKKWQSRVLITIGAVTLVIVVLIASCGAPLNEEPIEKVVVETVIETVEVIKEVAVEKIVKETVVVTKEKVVKETVIVEKIIEVTPTPVPTSTPTATPIPPTPIPPPPCRSLTWWQEALTDTKDIATLITVLNHDFQLETGGQWSEPGYTVRENSVFWTNLFENVASLPTGVRPIRVEGGWGVYFTTVEYEIPTPNGGGRWMRLCATPTIDIID